MPTSRSGVPIKNAGVPFPCDLSQRLCSDASGGIRLKSETMTSAAVQAAVEMRFVADGKCTWSCCSSAWYTGVG